MLTFDSIDETSRWRSEWNATWFVRFGSKNLGFWIGHKFLWVCTPRKQEVVQFITNSLGPFSVVCLFLDNETFNTRDVDFPYHTTKIARCPFTVKIVSLLKLLFQHLLAVGNPGHVLFHTFYLWWTISGLSFLDFAQNFECCYIKKKVSKPLEFRTFCAFI